MSHKRITMMSILLATLMLVSLFAVVSSTASVSGQASGTTAPFVGGTMAGTSPAVSTWFSSMNTSIFAVDTSGALWYKSIIGGSSNWESLGGVCTASPAAVSWNDQYTDRMDVFVRGTDGALWHKYYQNGWSKWESLGGKLVPNTGPTVSSWSKGRLDVFVQGTDGALWHKAWTGTSWSSWQSLGGKLTSSPAAASSASGVIDVFVCGTDGAVWYRNWNGATWLGWKSLGGGLPPNTGPAVNYYSNTLFVQGTDHQLWRKNSANGWTGVWATLAGKPPEALSASSPASTNIAANMHTMVSVSTTSGNIWYSLDSLANWNQWTSAGSPP